MIVNPEAKLALSNLRWVDAGSIWSYAFDEAEPRLTQLSEFKWLSLVRGLESHFAVVHHSEGQEVRLSAHSYKSVADPISSIDLCIETQSADVSKTSVAKFVGNASIWSFRLMSSVGGRRCVVSSGLFVRPSHSINRSWCVKACSRLKRCWASGSTRYSISFCPAISYRRPD